MRYLSGAVYAPCLAWEYGGLMLTPNMGNTPNMQGVVWAADNGCFSDRFNLTRWLLFLEKWQGQGYCLFAVAPDVPFNMEATWERSRRYLPVIRELGYPAGLAIQNGVTCLEWNSFDAVFIAGDKRFKTSRVARSICEEARQRGKHIHIARRNSLKALQEAQGMGADTVDGTYLKFAPDKNWTNLQRWFQLLKPETQMELW